MTDTSELVTDTSELVAMVEDIKERREAKQQRREDIAEIKRLLRRLAASKGIDVPDSPNQNGDESTWNVFD